LKPEIMERKRKQIPSGQNRGSREFYENMASLLSAVAVEVSKKRKRKQVGKTLREEKKEQRTFKKGRDAGYANVIG